MRFAGSDDASCRLFDIRTNQEAATFTCVLPWLVHSNGFQLAHYGGFVPLLVCAVCCCVVPRIVLANRFDAVLLVHRHDKILCGITSVHFSISGRFYFAGTNPLSKAFATQQHRFAAVNHNPRGASSGRVR